MVSPPKQHWQRCRRALRWCRILVLLVLLAFFACVLYLNQIGVPGFIREQVEAELRARGLDVQLGRVRLHGFHELTARNLQFGKTGPTNGPQLFIRSLDLRLQLAALKRLEFKLESVGLRQGQLLWPVVSTNGAAESLAIDDIVTELRFGESDQWVLDRFDGRFLGTQMQVSATILNASQLRRWVASSPPTPSTNTWQGKADRWATRLKHVQLAPKSTLTLRVAGDASDAVTLRAELKVRTLSAQTPWGKLDDLTLAARVAPSATIPGEIEARLDLKVRDLATADQAWRFGHTELASAIRLSLTNQTLTSATLDCTIGTASAIGIQTTNVHLLTTTRPTTNQINAPLRTDLALDAAEVVLRAARTRTNHLTAQVTHSLTNFTAIDGEWRLAVQQLATRWGQIDNAHLSGQVSSPNWAAPGPSDLSWGAWSMIDTLHLDWEFHFGAMQSPELELQSLSCMGRWRPPDLRVQRLHSDLYGGHLEAMAALDVASRTLDARMEFDCDLRKVRALFKPDASPWLEQLHWAAPPRVTAEGRVVLPAWTDAQPDWRGEVLPTLRMTGTFTNGPAAFRGLALTGAGSPFSFSNLVLRLPDLTVTRPDGGMRLDYAYNLQTEDFQLKIESQLDPKALTPLLDPPQMEVLDLFQFTEPPDLRGEIWGRWNDLERTGFNTQLVLTNFTFKGEHIDSLRTTVGYSNLFCNLRELELWSAGRYARAPSAGYDVREQVLYVTNGISTMDPYVATKLMGPKIYDAIAPYRFATPPLVRINGRVPTDDPTKADLHFQVSGTDFTYWRFHVPEISGDVYWRGKSLSVTNVLASFYKGRLKWSGEFDFTPPVGNLFQFQGNVQDADLRLLMKDLSAVTNQLEGRLNGDLVITSANTDNWKSWQGHGDATLREGFLWNIPIFGIVSPVLSKMVPGLGQSRASAATGSFKIRDSVIHTTDLEVRASALRMQYDGSVDFDGNVDAKVQSEILRDAWAVGRVVSLALWPLAKVFEYKVTGTLTDPKSEPLYIPKLLFFPFHPVKTLRDIFTDPDAGPKETPRK